MTRVDWPTQLKILIGLQDSKQAKLLQLDLECLGHRVQPFQKLGGAVEWLRKWQPDLIVVEEEMGRGQPDAGLRLAEYCRATEDRVNGWPSTRTLLLISVQDWNRFKRAQQTGAHVVFKGTNFDAVIRYIQTIADNLATDRMLGPALIGIHKYKGEVPHPKCDDCEWIGGTVSYASSQTDLECLTPVRIALLNILLFRRRGQSPTAIVDVCGESLFLKRILRGHVLRGSAVKMEMTRLRKVIGEALGAIGAPYTGDHFLPFVLHGLQTYRLSGNRRLIHVPDATSQLQG
ncbi:MAG TPA: hypothetical protein VI386_00505 [Candidatus Sulfotelmatobacter sp.]